MFAVMGATGQVGGAVARTLLARGHRVRAIVRSEAKGKEWLERGCEIAVASTEERESLVRAFTGTDGVFAMLQPIFDPSKEFEEARAAIESLYGALAASKPPKVAFLSTIGGHVERRSLLEQLHLMEERIGELPMPVVFVRAGWFMENASWDVASAKETGVLPSFLYPLDRRIPMVATEDVGQTAAGLLEEEWQGRRGVELEGPVRLSPNEVAAALSRVLRRTVRASVVPRETWEGLFRKQGMTNPEPRMQMLDGFNEQWIRFEGDEDTVRKGTRTIDEVLQTLVNRG